MQTLRIHLLGDFSLNYDGETVASLSAPRSQSLLAYLLLHRDAPQPRRQISYLFWPESAESQARTNLRKLIYDLRKAWPESDDFLNLDGPEIQWRDDTSFMLDVEEFENLANQATSIPELKKAIEVYGGDLLPNCYDDWVMLERQRLHQLFLDTLERLIEQLEAARDYQTAITYTHRLLQHAPLREDTYRRLMRLYALNGDRAGVLRTYHSCATALQKELQVEPSQLTREAYERLLKMDKPLSVLPPTTPDLVGRSAEWAQLQGAWRTAEAGQPHWALLSGEDGVGKTRLAEELLQWAAKQGIANASVKCYPIDADQAYAAVTAILRARPLPTLNKLWLTEISRLLPEILVDHPNLSAPGPLTEDWQRHRFHEALARAMLAKQPLLIFIDDLQWCDQDSLRWLNYLIHFDPAARVLLLSTLRMEDLADDHPLVTLIPALQRSDQLTEIKVEPLDESETALLATNALEDGSAGRNPAEVYQETKGNPLFTLEMLRAGLPSDSQDGKKREPFTINNAIETRLKHLSPQARHLTDLAATLGRPFSAETLARTSETSEEEFVSALDELWQHHVVREHAQDEYEFSHKKLGEVAYAGLSEERRRELHRKVAEALETSLDGELDLVSGEIAVHYEKAGRLDQAISFYMRAGDASRQMYANEAAINYYQQALALSPEGENVEAMLRMGEVWQLVGNWTVAEALYRQTLQIAEDSGDLDIRAHCEAALGELLRLKGEYNDALEWLERAQQDYETLGDRKGVCDVLEKKGEIYYWKMDYASALGCHETQLQIAEKIKDRQAVGNANGSLGMIYWQQGEFERALACFETQFQIAKETDDLPGASSALGHLGWLHLRQVHIAHASTLFEEELKLANETGDQLGIAQAIRNIGSLYMQQGDYAKAFGYFTQQLEISSGLGYRQDMSRAFRNLGSIYFEQGEHQQALRCNEHSLKVALEIDAPRSLGRALGDIAIILSIQEKYDQAGRLFDHVLTLMPESNVPYHLSKYLYHFALLRYSQDHLEQAQDLNSKALSLAQEIERREIQFKASILDVHLQVRRGQTERSKAVEALSELLKKWQGDQEQAALHYAIWQLLQERDAHRRKAADLYESLYARTPRWEYRQRYQDLTGESLPDPPPLPDLPEVVPDEELDLKSLLEGVEKILEDLPSRIHASQEKKRPKETPGVSKNTLPA
jgi:DNA-binding SARP family transcriptional activator/Tfp pilus assembly protein PilF